MRGAAAAGNDSGGSISISSSVQAAAVVVPDSPVGYLCRDVPPWAASPPIEAVVFAWGASEDHQLGLDTEPDIPQPKVVEALLGIRFAGCGARAHVAVRAGGGVLCVCVCLCVLCVCVLCVC
jgi:hypothetical protein